MNVRISDRVMGKIKDKHGLEWNDVKTIFENDDNRLDVRTGNTGISFGITDAGVAVTAITVLKENTRWLKTARPMTEAEKKVFRGRRR